jgi:hypothetical protein
VVGIVKLWRRDDNLTRSFRSLHGQVISQILQISSELVSSAEDWEAFACCFAAAASVSAVSCERSSISSSLAFPNSSEFAGIAERWRNPRMPHPQVLPTAVELVKLQLHQTG